LEKTMSTDAWLDAKVREELVPSEAELEAVREALDRVERRIDSSAVFRISSRHPCGSFAKGTMLRGRKEADLVLVLADAPTDQTLRELEALLSKDLPGLESVQTIWKAVGVRFKNGVTVDVLPVAERGVTPEGASIPRKLRHALSGPQHVQWFAERAQGRPLHSTVRLLKHFRQQTEAWEPLSSFTLEVLAVEILKNFPGKGLAGHFEEVLAHVANGFLRNRVLPQPVAPGHDLIAHLDDSRKDGIESAARQALNHLRAGNLSVVFSGRKTVPPPATNLGGRTLA
jgi:hypothetical protein